MGRRFVAEETSDDLLNLLTLVMEIVNEQTRLLLESEIVASKYKSRPNTNKLIDSLSQKQVEQLLLRSEIITEDVHSELHHVRKTRNTFVHSIKERTTFEETATASSEAERAVTILNDIVERNDGIRPINIR